MTFLRNANLCTTPQMRPLNRFQRAISQNACLRGKCVPLGVKTIISQFQGLKISKKLPKIGPNRHFALAAKSAKSWSSHISVIDEAIRVKFDRQMKNGKKYPNSAKLGQKGSCGGHVTHFWNFGTNISRTVEARNFKFGTETDGSEF